MRDLVFVLMVIAFFATATAYVRACSSVVGPEPAADDERSDEEPAA